MLVIGFPECAILYIVGLSKTDVPFQCQCSSRIPQSLVKYKSTTNTDIALCMPADLRYLPSLLLSIICLQGSVAQIS